MPLNYELIEPLDVPTYAFGQGIMRLNPHNTSFRPFCTIFNHSLRLCADFINCPSFNANANLRFMTACCQFMPQAIHETQFQFIPPPLLCKNTQKNLSIFICFLTMDSNVENLRKCSPEYMQNVQILCFYYSKEA